MPERGVASASDSGRISSISAEKLTSDAGQPYRSMNSTPSGENRNWPNEPAAVPAPSESERQDSGTSLPKAPSTMLNEQPESPKPIRTPAERSSIPGVLAFAIKASPSA